VVIAPIFGRSPQSWHGGDGRLMFVGNAGHLPNRQAIGWLCGKFAREFAKQNAARIAIVGAGPDDVPAGLSSNVDLFGSSTAEAVEPPQPRWRLLCWVIAAGGPSSAIA
jgi:hypothetical protein